MAQVIQVAGSLFILVPFVLVQMGRLSPASRRYSTLNLIGSSVLAVDALHGREWGFLLLEVVWAVVSLVALVKALRGDRGGRGQRAPGRRGPASSARS